MSGLNAAQARVKYGRNNIETIITLRVMPANNYSGAGKRYVRGWRTDNGVYVSGVQRGKYDAFITNQLRGAQNQSSGGARYEQMSKIASHLLADKSSSPSGSLQSFLPAANVSR